MPPSVRRTPRSVRRSAHAIPSRVRPNFASTPQVRQAPRPAAQRRRIDATRCSSGQRRAGSWARCAPSTSRCARRTCCARCARCGRCGRQQWQLGICSGQEPGPARLLQSLLSGGPAGLCRSQAKLAPPLCLTLSWGGRRMSSVRGAHRRKSGFAAFPDPRKGPRAAAPSPSARASAGPQAGPPRRTAAGLRRPWGAQKLAHSLSVPVLAAAATAVCGLACALAPKLGRVTFLARSGPRRSLLAKVGAGAAA